MLAAPKKQLLDPRRQCMRAVLESGRTPKCSVYEIVSFLHPARFLNVPDCPSYALLAREKIYKNDAIGTYLGSVHQADLFHADYNENDLIKQVYAYDMNKELFQSAVSEPGPSLVCESLSIGGNETRFINDLWCRSGKNIKNAEAEPLFNPLDSGKPIQVIRATKQIEKGDEIISDYGEMFWNKISTSLCLEHHNFQLRVQPQVRKQENLLKCLLNGMNINESKKLVEEEEKLLSEIKEKEKNNLLLNKKINNHNNNQHSNSNSNNSKEDKSDSPPTLDHSAAPSSSSSLSPLPSSSSSSAAPSSSTSSTSSPIAYIDLTQPSSSVEPAPSSSSSSSAVSPSPSFPPLPPPRISVIPDIPLPQPPNLLRSYYHPYNQFDVYYEHLEHQPVRYDPIKHYDEYHIQLRIDEIKYQYGKEKEKKNIAYNQANKLANLKEKLIKKEENNRSRGNESEVAKRSSIRVNEVK
jgi:hypothetical protein